MSVRRSFNLTLSMVSLGLFLFAGNIVAWGKPLEHRAMEGNLASVLGQISYLYQEPMVAELAQPLPKIRIVKGSHTFKQMVTEIVRQSPGYRSETRAGVNHVYHRQLTKSKFNFLNLTFPEFHMPETVSELKLTFPTLEVALLNGSPTGGMATSGFGDPELAKDRLQEKVLKNVTGREVLFRAASESPTFFTILVFPRSTPRTREDAAQTTTNWVWQSFKSELKPIYIQPR